MELNIAGSSASYRWRLIAAAGVLGLAGWVAVSSTTTPAYNIANQPSGSAFPVAQTSVRPSATQSALVPASMPAGDTFLSQSNYWRSEVTTAPVDQNSPALVSTLARQAAMYYGGVAAFNVYEYNISFTISSASAVRRDVIWDDCQNKKLVPPGLTGSGGQFDKVPIPDDAFPSHGSDAALTIWSPSLDKIWEFWQAKKRPDGWHACWGGRIDNVSTTPLPYFLNGFGATATGLLGAAGAVTIAEVKAGHIDHVLALAIPSPANWDNFSWPAQRSDGSDTTQNSIPEGTRFRLDPSVNVGALPLSFIGKMIARAAQRYGFIVTDRAGSVSVIGESGQGIKSRTGTDPWDVLLGSTPNYLTMQGFPWSKLQAMPRNYLKAY